MPDKRPSDHDPSVLADEMDRQMEEEMVSDSSDALANAMEKMPKKVATRWVRRLIRVSN
jgi:hypothetical protein